MTDVLTPEQRRHNMRRVRGLDTKPEMVVRRGLHYRGFRYQLHRGDLPGRPDLVFPKYRAVIFVHGCFWHGHDCVLFKWPMTRPQFWREKIEMNRARDQRSVEALSETGWRIMLIWECALRGSERLAHGRVIEEAAAFLWDGKNYFHEVDSRSVVRSP